MESGMKKIPRDTWAARNKPFLLQFWETKSGWSLAVWPEANNRRLKRQVPWLADPWASQSWWGRCGSCKNRGHHWNHIAAVCVCVEQFPRKRGCYCRTGGRTEKILQGIVPFSLPYWAVRPIELEWVTYLFESPTSYSMPGTWPIIPWAIHGLWKRV